MQRWATLFLISLGLTTIGLTDTGCQQRAVVFERFQRDVGAMDVDTEDTNTPKDVVSDTLSDSAPDTAATPCGQSSFAVSAHDTLISGSVLVFGIDAENNYSLCGDIKASQSGGFSEAPLGIEQVATDKMLVGGIEELWLVDTDHDRIDWTLPLREDGDPRLRADSFAKVRFEEQDAYAAALVERGFRGFATHGDIKRVTIVSTTGTLLRTIGADSYSFTSLGTNTEDPAKPLVTPDDFFRHERANDFSLGTWNFTNTDPVTSFSGTLSRRPDETLVSVHTRLESGTRVSVGAGIIDGDYGVFRHGGLGSTFEGPILCASPHPCGDFYSVIDAIADPGQNGGFIFTCRPSSGETKLVQIFPDRSCRVIADGEDTGLSYRRLSYLN